MSSPLLGSEEMVLCQLFLQVEAAYSSVSELGELGFAPFQDVNPDGYALQRKFVNDAGQWDEMDRKLVKDVFKGIHRNLHKILLVRFTGFS